MVSASLHIRNILQLFKNEHKSKVIFYLLSAIFCVGGEDIIAHSCKTKPISFIYILKIKTGTIIWASLTTYAIALQKMNLCLFAINFKLGCSLNKILK